MRLESQMCCMRNHGAYVVTDCGAYFDVPSVGSVDESEFYKEKFCPNCGRWLNFVLADDGDDDDDF